MSWILQSGNVWEGVLQSGAQFCRMFFYQKLLRRTFCAGSWSLVTCKWLSMMIYREASLYCLSPCSKSLLTGASLLHLSCRPQDLGPASCCGFAKKKTINTFEVSTSLNPHSILESPNKYIQFLLYFLGLYFVIILNTCAHLAFNSAHTNHWGC